MLVLSEPHARPSHPWVLRAGVLKGKQCPLVELMQETAAHNGQQTRWTLTFWRTEKNRCVKQLRGQEEGQETSGCEDLLMEPQQPNLAQ